MRAHIYLNYIYYDCLVRSGFVATAENSQNHSTLQTRGAQLNAPFALGLEKEKITLFSKVAQSRQ